MRGETTTEGATRHAARAVAPVVYRARRQLRHRGWAALGVVALVGLLSGVTLAAFVGARRNDTAYDRMLRRVQPWDVLVNPDLGRSSSLDRARVDALPEVDAASGVDGFFVGINGNFDGTDEVLAFTDATGLGGRFHPQVLAGRMPNPARADEVVVNRTYARQHHVAPGSSMTLTLVNGADITNPDPQRQELGTVTITGIVVLPDEVTQADGVADGRVLMTPAFEAAHHEWLGYFGALIWLHHGIADVPAFRDAVQKMVPSETIIFQTQANTTAAVRRAVRPETIALVAFGLLSGTATLVIGALALVRQATDDDEDQVALAGAGMTRVQRWSARMLGVAMLAGSAAIVAIAVATAMSGAFPIGPAATAEPSPGLSVNVAAVLLGGVATAVLLVAAAAVPTWRASRLRSADAARSTHSYRVVDAVARSGASPAAVVGVGMAIGTVPGRRSYQWVSLIGSVVAVCLLVGAVVFGASLRHLLDVPVSFGWRWDAVASLDASDQSELAEMQQYLTAVPAREGVAEAAILENSAVEIGTASVAAIGWHPVRGEIGPTLLSGRLPTGPDEVALGGRTAAATGLTVGSQTTVTGRTGSQTMHVVGTVVFPSVAKYPGADNTDLGSGVLINQAALDAIAPAPGEQHLVVKLDPGADPQAVLLSGYDDLVQANDLELDLAPQRPGAVVDLEQVRNVPLWLAGLAAIGATLAVGNLVASEVARRRRDLALLKSIGFSSRQVRRAVMWHATTVAVVTVAIAVPLGAVVGRVAWRFVAHTIGVSPAPTMPPLLFVAVLPLAVLVANVVAAVPGRVASRTSIAVALRSE